MIIKIKFFFLLWELLCCIWSRLISRFESWIKAALHSHKLESGMWKTLAPNFISVARTFAECSMNVFIVIKWSWLYVYFTKNLWVCSSGFFLFCPFPHLFYFLVQFDCYLMRFSPSFWCYDCPIWIVVVHCSVRSESKNIFRNRGNGMTYD